MILTNLTIKDLFTEDAKLTFLVGAGCSVDAPSCLPAGRNMMEAIVKYTCAESEIKKILELEDLRFEALVEIIRDFLDPLLKIIDFYGMSDKANLQHYFMAEMIKKGHFVITTNFDFLIEHALLHSNVSKDDIVPVITKKDFQNYQDPNEQVEKGKKAIYKIHGSTRNIITEEITRESLITTIQAFGSNKEGNNVFQLEAFKQPLFENITNDRSLVVMGYSGSDDFDIVPTLKVLKNLRNLIWINYSKSVKMGEEKIYEINASTVQLLNKIDKGLRKVTEILLEIQRMGNTDHVYRVDVNTTEMVRGLLDFKPKLSSDDFSVNPMDWLKESIKIPSEILKHYIPSKIYLNLDMYDDALKCLEKMLQIAEESDEQSLKSAALNNMASIYYTQGNYSEALSRYEEALKIAEQLGNLNLQGTYLSNIGLIYDEQKNYPEALSRYEEALKIAEQSGDLRGKSTRLNNIASIYYTQENYSEALSRYEEALKIAEQLGNLNLKGIFLNNIGLIYNEQKNYPEALSRYEEALKIAEQLGDLSGKATRLNNIATSHLMQGNFSKALKLCEEALEIFNRLGLSESSDVKATKTTIETIKHELAAAEIYPEPKIIRQIISCQPEWGTEQVKASLKSISENILKSMSKQSILKWMGKATLVEQEPNVLEVSAGPEIKGTFRIEEDPTKGTYIQLDWEKRSERTGRIWEPIIKALTEVFETSEDVVTLPTGPIASARELISCHPKWDTEQLKPVLKSICIKTFENLSKKPVLKWVGKATLVEQEPNILEVSAGSEIKGIFQIGEDPTKGRYIQLDWEKRSERAGWVWEPLIEQLKNVFGVSEEDVMSTTSSIKSIRNIISCHPEWGVKQLKTFLKSICENIFENMRKQPVLQWMGKATLVERDPNVLEVSAGPEIKGTFRIAEDPTKGRYIQLDWEERSKRAGWIWNGINEQLTKVFATPFSKLK
ncbi:MAG: tetratricopeptide repeat protein [Promethearchaeota archaeon]